MTNGQIDLSRRFELRVPRRLESPNTWNGRHWRVKHKITQEWEQSIGSAVADLVRAHYGGIDFPLALMAIGGPKMAGCMATERRRVSVIRVVPSGRNFIRDDDNLRFAVKPLLDALKRRGYIKNDSRRWLELPLPQQRVSDDGRDWTHIVIEPVEQQQEARTA